MKKLFSALLSLVLIALTVTPIFAEERSTTVNYNVAPGYYVTIDGTVTLGNSCNVKLDDVVVEEGQQVVVRIDNNQTFQLSNGKTGSVDYKVKVGNTEKGKGDMILAVNPSTSRSGSAALSFECTTSQPKYAGTYTGTISFIVGVESAS